MELIQPYLLWGSLAVLIPVVIHFWHQKKGKTMAWAATRWLLEKDQQQQRGIRLDNRLLLLLRCLIVLLLALLASQPVLNGLISSTGIQKIHLVQPEKFVAENFRFELENAIQKGESVYWVNGVSETVKNPAQLPNQQEFSSMVLQSSITRFAAKNTEIHLYLLNTPELANSPFIRVPAAFQWHAVVDSSRQTIKNYLAVSETKKVYIDRLGKLVNKPVLASDMRFHSTPVYSGPITVLVNTRDKTEQQTVLAALKALSDVYILDFQIDNKQAPGRQYQWVITDRKVANPVPATLYVVTGQRGISTVPNVVYVSEKWTPQTAEIARTGQLPEWLGELFVRHLNLKPETIPLTQEQIKAVFVTTAQPESKQPETARSGFLLALVVLLGAERWMALKKNA